MSRRTARKEFRRWLWPLQKTAIAAVAVFLIFTFVFSLRIMRGSAMHPDIHDGDMCLFYRQDSPKRNDIISYRKGGTTRTGRAVAIAGDRVSVDHGRLYVNGYEQEAYYTTPGSVAEHTVPQGKVFIMNDYRSDEKDSRRYGDVSLDDVEGVYFASLRTGGFSG